MIIYVDCMASEKQRHQSQSQFMISSYDGDHMIDAMLLLPTQFRNHFIPEVKTSYYSWNHKKKTKFQTLLT